MLILFSFLTRKFSIFKQLFGLTKYKYELTSISKILTTAIVVHLKFETWLIEDYFSLLLQYSKATKIYNWKKWIGAFYTEPVQIFETIFDFEWSEKIDPSLLPVIIMIFLLTLHPPFNIAVIG